MLGESECSWDKNLDAIEGSLGIEWFEGKSMKYLLQEDFSEDEDIDLDDASSPLVTDENPLQIRSGMSCLFENEICMITLIRLDVLMESN